MKSFIIVAFLFLFAYLLTNCKDPECIAPYPKDFICVLLDQEGNNLLRSESIIPEIDIFFINNNDKKVSLPHRIVRSSDPDPKSYYSYFYADTITYLAAEGFENFYLEFNNQIDTLNVIANKKRPRNLDCEGFVYTVTSVKFNGKQVDIFITHLKREFYLLYTNI